LGDVGGRRARPVDVDPAVTYTPEVYDHALKRVRDLVHSKGYLNAVIGPLSVLRDTCSKRSKAGECIPEPKAEALRARCLKDPRGLPLPAPPVPEAFACRPDPAHNVECSPEITLRIPIHLGPQTTLYDLAFDGNRSLTEKALTKVADLTLGDPLSNVELE